MKQGVLIFLAIFLVACGSDNSDKQTQEEKNNVSEEALIEVDIARVKDIIIQRCATCHSKEPADDVFRVAPSNVMFDTAEQMQQAAARIYARSVATQTMPFMNKTQMSEEERSLIGEWVKAGAPIK